MDSNQSHTESQSQPSKQAPASKFSPLHLDSDSPSSSSPVPTRTTPLFHRVPLLSFLFSTTSSGLLALLLPSRLRLSLARPPAALVRWYVLGLAASLQLVNGIQCMSFGPIANTAEAVFGWSDPVIMLLNGIGAVLMIPLSLPVAWFVEHIGLRPTLLMTATIYCTGFMLQAIPLSPEHNILRTGFLIFADVCGGLGATFVQTAPSSLSVAWFPPRLRTFATSVAVQSFSVGIALGYFIGPWFVPDITSCENELKLNGSSLCIDGIKRNISQGDIAEARGAINIYLALQAGMAIVLFVCAMLYLPECPKDAPSVAATTERHSFVKGVKGISKNWSVWLVVVSMSLVYGVVPAWASILTILLRPLSIPQRVTGLIGVAAQILTALGSFFISYIQGLLQKSMKLSIVMLNLFAALAALVFCLMAIGVIQYNMVTLCLMLVLAIALPQTTLPIGYEFSAELAYPVHESTPSALIILVSQSVNVAFYVFVSIATAPRRDGAPNLFESHAQVLWWVSVLTCVVQGLSVAFVRSRYTRLDLDAPTPTPKEKNDVEEPAATGADGRKPLLGEEPAAAGSEKANGKLGLQRE